MEYGDPRSIFIEVNNTMSFGDIMIETGEVYG